VIERVVSRLKPDGIILAPPLCNDLNVLRAAERTGVPLVRIAGTVPGYGATVEVREEAIAADLVRHLLSLGHRRIGMIGPPDGHGAAHQRVTGYRAALSEAGLDIDPALLVRGDFSFASGVAGAAELLALRDRPTAIFAANDGMALGVVAMASRMGFALPEDLAIAGFDDSPGSRMVFPALTTVRQPIAALAEIAVRTLIGKDLALPPPVYELILRGSTTGSRDLVLTEIDA